MGKYILKRILFSIVSLLIVIMTVMLLVYSLINRNVIFQTDDRWNKTSGNDQKVYEYNQFQKYQYLTYTNYTNFVKSKYSEKYGEDNFTTPEYSADLKAIKNAKTYRDNPTVKEFIEKYESEGYEIVYLPQQAQKNGTIKKGYSAYLLAVKENNVFLRLWLYIKGLFTVETTSDVTDPALTEEMRGIKFINDPYGWWAITGSGTTHKYLLYFDGRFPFIHQNWIHLHLGISYTQYRNQEIFDVITAPNGSIITSMQQFPNMIGTDEYEETAIDFHTLTYNAEPTVDDLKNYPDNYTSSSMHRAGLSRLEISFVMGIISTIIAYLLGLPIGILMARKKDKLADKIGNLYIIFIMAVPSLAYIFMFAAFGTKVFNLPYNFATAEVQILGYILPIISMSLPSVGSLMKWMRRYMIDQMNSDYVKFARAEGLSEREIYRTHISRNALIYIVHGIPGSILGSLIGAIITERVYNVPGVGNLLTRAINGHDNGVIIASTVFYTTITIISIILGDILLAKYDPRISLSSERGGGR